MFDNGFDTDTNRLHFEVTFLAINEDLDPIIDGHIGQVKSFVGQVSKSEVDDAIVLLKMARWEDSFYRTMRNMTGDLLRNDINPKFKVTVDCIGKEVQDFEFEMVINDHISRRLQDWSKELRMNAETMVYKHLTMAYKHLTRR
jgi:hypothetical protein